MIIAVAEAMACGTPVLASDVTALPDTAGAGNALFVEPSRTESIAEGLDRLAGDAALRSSLRERGLKRAMQFSWDRVGAAVAEVLAAAGA